MGLDEKKLVGYWKFDEIMGNTVPDISGNQHALRITGKPEIIRENKLGNVIALDGSTQWLSTDKPVVCTDQSFSVAAWVYLDGAALKDKLELRKTEHSFALTAVSQDSPTHSPFYLGIRRIEKTLDDGTYTAALKWNFTLAPVDGSETAILVWEHAHSKSNIFNMLNQWVLLVGVCDVKKRCAGLYVPNINESGSIFVPDAWTFWNASGGLQVGRALWLGRNVDQWPGKLGPIRIFSGVLNEEDAKRLCREDTSIPAPV